MPSLTQKPKRQPAMQRFSPGHQQCCVSESMVLYTCIQYARRVGDTVTSHNLAGRVMQACSPTKSVPSTARKLLIQHTGRTQAPSPKGLVCLPLDPTHPGFRPPQSHHLFFLRSMSSFSKNVSCISLLSAQCCIHASLKGYAHPMAHAPGLPFPPSMCGWAMSAWLV
jgi:hypothetical protein